MGFLSRLFGASPSRSDSLVVRWVQNRMEELEDEELITPEGMFAVFVKALSMSAERNPVLENDKEMRPFIVEWEAHYANDAVLFELGCYMYFRVDLWLLLKRPDLRDPDLRDRISNVFSRDFIRLFTQVLQIKNVADLFDQRVAAYGELARSGTDAKRYDYYLSQLLIRTRDNRTPRPYDFGTEAFIVIDSMEGFFVKTKLRAWETATLPAFVRTLGKLTATSPEEAVCIHVLHYADRFFEILREYDIFFNEHGCQTNRQIGEVVLFEVRCYFLFLLDLNMFRQNISDDQRSRILFFCEEVVVEATEKCFAQSNVIKIIENRLELYAQSIVRTTHLQDVLDRARVQLEQLFVRFEIAKTLELVQIDGGNVFYVGDALELFPLNSALAAALYGPGTECDVALGVFFSKAKDLSLLSTYETLAALGESENQVKTKLRSVEREVQEHFSPEAAFEVYRKVVEELRQSEETEGSNGERS
jgi:hypothetical protein